MAQTTPQTAPRPLFTTPEQAELVAAFREAWTLALRPGEAPSIDGDVDDVRVRVEVVVAHAESGDETRVEAVALLDENETRDLVELRAAAIEFALSWLGDWLRGDRFPRPHIDWKEYRWEEVALRFRGESTNRRLRDEADRLLREAGFDVDD
jgi:hypothetical protein